MTVTPRFAVLLLILRPALATGQGQPAAHAAPVCYTVAYDSIDAGVGVEVLPKTLRRYAGTAGGRLVTDDTIPFWTHGYTWSSWRPLSGDSIELLLSEGQIELMMHVKDAGDTLQGHLTYATDAFRSRLPRARITAARRPCPS